jgi:hypothetical protein
MAAGMVADMAVQPTAVGTEAVQCIEAAAAAAAPCTGGAEAAPEAARAAAAAVAAAVYGLDLCVFNRLARADQAPGVSLALASGVADFSACSTASSVSSTANRSAAIKNPLAGTSAARGQRLAGRFI